MIADLPDDETIRDLEPEEIAGYLMAYLNVHTPPGKHIIPDNVIRTLRGSYSHEALLGISAAWQWCRREGYLAPTVHEVMSTVPIDEITKRGAQIKGPADVHAWRARSLLPRAVLHPRVSEVVWADFLRGDYDSAIFKAFKSVEELVREAGGFGSMDLGTELMRKAFKKDGGPLSDRRLPDGERDAEGHLFAGAIGVFKNPGSHRTVNVRDPAYAVEAIMFASLLARIADNRRPTPTAP